MQTLMNKNTPILEIEMDKNVIVKTGRVLDNSMMPIQLQDGFTTESLNKWLSDRRIPEKREGLKEARLMFPNFDADLRFFSLSDQYWIQQSPRDKWEKYNFFTNRYSTNVGDAFFEPWNVNKATIGDPSPDRTTNGVLRKRWEQDETGQSFLIKAGSVLYHQEPLSEVLASIMLKKLDIIPFVPYELVISGLRFCSRCPNFVTENTEFVPAAAIFSKEARLKTESVYDHLIKMCLKFNIIGAKEYIDKMIVADRILCNTDRHLGNFGFLRSADNGKILGFAPLFDCGSSYWGNTNDVAKRESRLFADKEKEIFAKAAKKGLLKNARSNKAMIDLIKMYPDIKRNKKEDIIKMLEDVDLELEMMDGSAMNEKDKDKTKPDHDLIIEF